jgi:ketosteroid isomerase-like protein
MTLHSRQAWTKPVFSILVAMLSGTAMAHGEGSNQIEVTEAEAVLDEFNSALSEGDGEAALELLSDDAVILEGGLAETRGEYADHHLASDMAFLANIEQERLSRQILQAGGALVIITRTQLSGHYDGRKIDMVNAETAVLVQANGHWQISHLHWSD